MTVKHNFSPTSYNTFPPYILSVHSFITLLLLGSFIHFNVQYVQYFYVAISAVVDVLIFVWKTRLCFGHKGESMLLSERTGGYLFTRLYTDRIDFSDQAYTNEAG